MSVPPGLVQEQILHQHHRMVTVFADKGLSVVPATFQAASGTVQLRSVLEAYGWLLSFTQGWLASKGQGGSS